MSVDRQAGEVDVGQIKFGVWGPMEGRDFVVIDAAAVKPERPLEAAIEVAGVPGETGELVVHIYNLDRNVRILHLDITRSTDDPPEIVVKAGVVGFLPD